MKSTRPGSVILLNGASSAGKSTLARAVQNAAEVPFLRFSLDLFLFGEILPTRRGGPFTWSLLRPRVFAGYYGCLAALAQAGNGLEADHIFGDEPNVQGLTRGLMGIDLFLVGVYRPMKNSNAVKASAATARSEVPSETSRRFTRSAPPTSRWIRPKPRHSMPSEH